MTSTPVLSVPIPLTIPLAVMRDSRAITVQSLTLARPKTRHAKTLALLVGSDLLAALMGSEPTAPDGEDDAIDMRAMVAEIAPLLFSSERLDAFQSLLADLLGISADEAGEIDPLDLVAVMKGFVGFFPALQSIGSRSSPRT